MNSFLNILTEKLFNLYYSYEDYAFNSYVKNENKYKLVVSFIKNNTIHFAMFEKNALYENELVDELYISFDEERELYEAVSLRLFVKALGNVMIHKIDKDIYFNTKHKRYMMIIAKDNGLRNLFDKIIINQEKEIINLDNAIIKENAKLVKNKTYSKDFLYKIDNRTKINRSILRRW